MNKQKSVTKVLDVLRGTASSLAESVTRLSAGGEIELLTSQLNALRQPPPTLREKDFKYPKGDEVLIPTAGNDPSAVFERIIDEADFLPVWFLEQGAQIQRSIARVVLTKPHTSGGFTFPPGTGWATGFMVSRSLFLTNNHVIPDEAFAKKIRMQFNFQLGPDGTEQLSESFLPTENDVFRTNVRLDYTLIRLQPLQSAPDRAPKFPGDRWGFIQLNDSPMFREKQHFNIIQHPDGRRKEVSLQDNEIDKLFTNFVLYKADTEPGSSGSPVFDNLWQLVALHHAGGERDASGQFVNNEGIRIDKIVDDLREHFSSGPNADPSVLTELGI